MATLLENIFTGFWLESWLNSYSIFGASLIVALLLANLETFLYIYLNQCLG